MFIGYVNKLIRKFGHFQPQILINLFKTYYCSFLDLVLGGLIRLDLKVVPLHGMEGYENF